MPRLANVLIYDSDTRGRETLVYGFEGEGVKAASATTTAELPSVIQVTRPQALILTLRDEIPAAIELLKLLAEAEETRALPRLVLAPIEEFPPELRGPTSFLALPVFVRDVITAAKLLVAGEPNPEHEGQIELTGALSEFGLHFIVRTMVGLRRSGIVQVERGNRKGELRFSEGDVVSAQVGSLQGHAALHQLLLWEEAALEVRFRPVVRLGQSLPGGEELLDDCERFLRDFSHATKNIGHAQSLFVQDAERVARLLDTIPAEVVPVMRLFDGQRSLGDVLEDSPFRVFDTLRTITRLLDMGIIRRKAIERPTTFQSHLRRGRNEDWIRPGAPAASPVAPPTAPAEPPEEDPAEQRVGLFTRRRAPRRRSGEVPAPPLVDRGRARGEDSPEHASVAVVAPLPRAGGSTSTTSMAVHGELRVPSGGRAGATAIPDVPKVVIDFGATEQGGEQGGEQDGSEEPPTPQPSVASSLRTAEPDPSGRGRVQPTGQAPAEGPSIMVDPRLLAELDAFERQAPAAPSPPAPPAPPAPPPSPPAPPPPAPPSSVVSFVHANTPARQPMPAVVPLGAIPTVAVPAVAPPKPVPTPPSGEPAAGRRASSEFNAVESDFFAREAELYEAQAGADDAETETETADLDAGENDQGNDQGNDNDGRPR